MRILLDTHIALWAISNHPRLSQPARRHLLDPTNEIYVSAASIWEIAIKHAKSPGLMPINPDDAIAAFTQSGFRMLEISAAHAAATRLLPSIHNDPFDRMLIAQATCEPLMFLTADRVLQPYSHLIVMA